MKLIFDLKVQGGVPSKQREALPGVKLVTFFLLVLNCHDWLHALVLVAAQILLFVAILLQRFLGLLLLELLYKSLFVASKRHCRATVE